MTPERFEDLVRPFRRELAAHCYRMLGSLADAEDQVQETLLRAWRGIDGFEGRASVRSWLYKIATNTCLDALRQRPRRGLPFEHGTPHDPQAPLAEVDPELLWVQPAPASLVEEFATRESVQLAFIVALQHLPPLQRAAVILRDVVGWSAAEVAELLDTTVASVNSALQRAREALEARPRRPPAPVDETLLQRYLRAWETRDLDAFAALLHEDVVASMPPTPSWFRGRDPLVGFVRPLIANPGLRMVRADAADDYALGLYRRAPGSDHFTARAIEIVTFRGSLVSELHVFLEPSLVPRFGLPTILR